MDLQQQLSEVDRREAKDLEAIDRAQSAKTLLDNSMLRDAFTAVETALVKKLRETATGAEEVEDIHRCLKLLTKVEAAIKKHISNGTLAEKDLHVARQTKRRLRLRLIR